MSDKKTINIAPSWKGIVPALLRIVAEGNDNNNDDIIKELMRCAEIADNFGHVVERLNDTEHLDTWTITMLGLTPYKNSSEGDGNDE